MFGRELSAAVALTLMIGCSDTPMTPTPPPVVNNTPPTIESVKAASARVEADEDVEITASVRDTETPLDQLTYTWSGSPADGAFTGSGATVKWRAPKQQTTPDVYAITLTVTERYMSAGAAKENKVSASVEIRYNDSPAETTSLASRFIEDFGTFSMSPEQCVRNFSDSCNGKQDELGDIRHNRATVQILSSTFTATKITFNPDRTAGTIEGPCVFEDIPNAGQPHAGRRERISGLCYMTTVYENARWWLCMSYFLDGSSTLDRLRYRVPGRILSQ